MREQEFFRDPAVDQLMRAFLALATELQVTRREVATLRKALETRGMLDTELLGRIACAAPSPEEEAELARYVAALLDPLRVNPPRGERQGD
ncbi:MAG: hypothetical protein JJT85_07360 [Chromatiales bacterium]|nr:hypothetical protein [Chromatiales bacterium]